MKTLLLLFASAFCALAQTTPDCQFTYTAAIPTSQTPPINNRFTTAGGPNGCSAWTFKYWTNAASATSVQIEGAADAVSGGVHAPTGSYTALTVAAPTGSGTNPATVATAGGAALCCDYYPWIRITVNTLTSSGAGTTIEVRAYGYRNNSAVNGNGGSGLPSGAASGDLGGNYPNPNVVNLSHVTNGSLADSGLVNPPVHLQPTSPGTPQTGNSNISGVGTFGQISVPDGTYSLPSIMFPSSVGIYSSSGSLGFLVGGYIDMIMYAARINWLQAMTTAGGMPTVTGCGTIGAQTGGLLAGTFVAGAVTTCTPVLTGLPASLNGYACLVWNVTAATGVPYGNIDSNSTTSATFPAIIIVAGNKMRFQCGLSY
jgi:hypothetical protein